MRSQQLLFTRLLDTEPDELSIDDFRSLAAAVRHAIEAERGLMELRKAGDVVPLPPGELEKIKAKREEKLREEIAEILDGRVPR
jgi:hypothetical protein